ncbi:Hypothetical predicted protein [Olea europaea subsp. europaea]|uniref:Uncharacterized protein n=1 Tax=Olea europaea subsp. europaea TaxID=158383 RepID=A0A8S0TQB3_OLEEU|nr:Hypothetical predicted protein [Olea europaea subsp. europaea]
MPCITSKRMEKIRVGTIPACIQTRELHSSEVERDVVVHICYLKMSLFAIDTPSTLVRCAKVIIPKRLVIPWQAHMKVKAEVEAIENIREEATTVNQFKKEKAHFFMETKVPDLDIIFLCEALSRLEAILVDMTGLAPGAQEDDEVASE